MESIGIFEDASQVGYYLASEDFLRTTRTLFTVAEEGAEQCAWKMLRAGYAKVGFP